MNREINKKQMKMASSKGEYVAKNEFFQELKEIKKDVKEVKKILINNEERSVVLPKHTKAKKKDVKITKLEIKENKLFAN